MSSAEPKTPAGFPSEAEADARLTADRFDIIALIAKADRRREAGDRRAANAYYSAAIRTAAADQMPPIDGLTDVTVRTDSAGPDFLDEETGIHMQTQDFRVSFNEARPWPHLHKDPLP